MMLLMEPVTRNLLDRVRGGDADAFAVLVERYGVMVLRTARLVLRDPELAEDVCQEVFLKSWRGIDSLRDEDPAAWLNRIAANEAVSAWRRRNRIAALRERLGYDPGAQRGADTEERLDLARALDRLRVGDRAILVLHYYQDLGVEDTAKAMGIPLDTAKSRLKTALRHLRELCGTGEDG
jgi:RNA polymerase sigma-70 factor (ECF subfamily)